MPQREELLPVSCSQCGIRIVPESNGLVPLHLRGDNCWSMTECPGSGLHSAETNSALGARRKGKK